MNQYGFVEIAIMKNDHLYRAQLPMNVPWSEVHDALVEMTQNVVDHIALIQEQERLAKEAADALPIEAEVITD